MRSIRQTWAAGLGALVLLAASPAAAGELARSFAAAEGGRLVLDLDFGSVDVVRYDGDRVHIEAIARGVGASGVHFGARADGADIYVRGQAEPWVGWLRSAPGVRLRARVPRGFRVELREPRSVELVGAQGLPVSLP